MPPRMALGGLNTARDERKIMSSPSASRHDATCAPCLYTSEVHPVALRRRAPGRPPSSVVARVVAMVVREKREVTNGSAERT